MFGATGRTGRLVLDELVTRGWTVNALVRDKAKLTGTHNVRVIEGEASNAASVAETIDGTDVVFSCLGLAEISAPTTAFSDIIKAILHEMKERGVSRIVAITSSAVLDHPTGGYRVKTGLPMFAHVGAEHVRNYESLRDSGLDWTAMCPVTLTSDIPRGHGRYAFEDLPPGSKETGYADLAQHMVELAEDSRSFGKRVGIASFR